MAFIDGKIPFMNAIAEIDKAGRLVVPKKMREALHLAPGTRLTLRTEGEAIIVRQETKPRGLYRKNGILVYDSGRPVPPDAVNWLEQSREERAEELTGEWPKT
jgi:AbrB family looped-hinge helix DNA binding protein